MFGFAPLNHASGIAPARLGPLLEERGFDSVWVPEHSHIPVSRDSAFVTGGELPLSYYEMMSPFVTLAAMSATTGNLVLATGVAQILEHDLIDLAKTVASLAVLAGPRVVLGVGAGWNREELANHRSDIPFAKRYQAIEERIDALRLIWSAEQPEYDGVWHRFTRSHINPKPPNGGVPIAMGMSGPLGLSLSARKADEWVPIDAFLRNEEGRPDVAHWVSRFRHMVEDGGRDPDGVPIRIIYSGPVKQRRLDACLEAGVSGLIFLAADLNVVDSPDATLRRLDEIAPFVGQYTAPGNGDTS
jgi:probable F420-dependent oxidoreductase